MATNTAATKTMTGKYLFVTGIGNGREIFFGRAIDEPFGDQISIEGKPISFTPQGFLVVRPFTTMVHFPLKNPAFQIQWVDQQPVIEELNTIYKTSITQLSRASFPLTFRWIEAAFPERTFFPTAFPTTASPWTRAPGAPWPNPATQNPFLSFFNGFTTCAEQFRRALFTSPQVTTAKELDKVTELEGDLTIEVGKITNEIAVKFNQLVNRDHELVTYFDAIQGFTMPIPPTHQLGGWLYLIHRLQVAKSWARRTGRTPFVREVNTLIKEGITRLNETILDHGGSLDTLITETCAQYGIFFETFGEMSPFANYTTPFTGTFDTFTFDTPMPTAVGAGV